MEENEEEWKERQEAELEFVQSAYSSEEAWITKEEEEENDIKRRGKSSTTTTTTTTTEIINSQPPNSDLYYVHRRLDLKIDDDDGLLLPICLTCRLPPGYPITAKLDVSSITFLENKNRKESNNNNAHSNNNISVSPDIQKVALDVLPSLLSQCRQVVATDDDIEEALFVVYSKAEEWIQEEWPIYMEQRINNNNTATASTSSTKTTIIFGRKLIYSHHIISKTKRSDIKKLAIEYNLTGYMKIGWPGIIIIEGLETNCLKFYDIIRRWNWQYLVIRGEMQEEKTQQHYTNLMSSTLEEEEASTINNIRKFTKFQEVDDMSIVANSCREVGLESLFLTSMKVYTNNNDEDEEDDNHNNAININQKRQEGCHYAALIHVDHMNDGKSYRKWLRKTCQEIDLTICLIKQFYPNDDFTNKTRPMIFVAISAFEQTSVTSFLKRWRTSRVDVDCKGKPCLERQMTVVVEGIVPLEEVLEKGGRDDGNNKNNNNTNTNTNNNYYYKNTEGDVTDTQENVAIAMERIGGIEWRKIIETAM